MSSLIGGLVDIPIDGVCDGGGSSSPQYGAISSGFGVHAVSATVSTEVPIADGPAIGVCGPPAVRDGG